MKKSIQYLVFAGLMATATVVSADVADSVGQAGLGQEKDLDSAMEDDSLFASEQKEDSMVNENEEKQDSAIADTEKREESTVTENEEKQDSSIADTEEKKDDTVAETTEKEENTVAKTEENKEKVVDENAAAAEEAFSVTRNSDKTITLVTRNGEETIETILDEKEVDDLLAQIAEATKEKEEKAYMTIDDVKKLLDEFRVENIMRDFEKKQQELIEKEAALKEKEKEMKEESEKAEAATESLESKMACSTILCLSSVSEPPPICQPILDNFFMSTIVMTMNPETNQVQSDPQATFEARVEFLQKCSAAEGSYQFNGTGLSLK